jgi:solute carrier family 1 (high affinity glutamate transporter) protein 2
VLLIHPGNPSITTGAKHEIHEHTAVSPLDTFLDVVRNMFPDNVIQATFQRVQTNYYTQRPKTRLDGSPKVQAIVKKRIDYVEGMNILGLFLVIGFEALGVIVFCTGFGIVISQFGERAKIIVDFFVILEAVIMKLVEVNSVSINLQPLFRSSCGSLHLALSV